MLNNNSMESFQFYHVVLQSKEQIGLHTQPTWELTYIVHGHGMRTISDITQRFSPGEVVLVPPNMPHLWEFDKKQKMVENITVIFNTDSLLQLGAQFEEMAEVVRKIIRISDSVSFTGESLHRLHHLLASASKMDRADRFATLLQVLNLIARSSDCTTVGHATKSNKDVEWLKKVAIYVSCNYKRDITIDTMAFHMGMGHTSFCVKFRKAAGKTFFTYLNEYRLWVACCLLAQGELSMSQVCYSSGFSNLPYFDRLFKQHFGVSPRQYHSVPSSLPPLL